MSETREDIGYKRGMPRMKMPVEKIKIQYITGPGAGGIVVMNIEDAESLIARGIAEVVK